jgi:hypothetical protein
MAPFLGPKFKRGKWQEVQERHSKVLLPLKEQLAMGREHKKRIELIDWAASFLIGLNLHLRSQNLKTPVEPQFQA